MNRYRYAEGLFVNAMKPYTKLYEHCQNVADLCYNLARYCNGVDQEHAYLYGLVHDIGRVFERARLNPIYHPRDGYNFLMEEGFPDLAMSTITHSFPDLGNISLLPGRCHEGWELGCDLDSLDFDSEESYIREKLKGYEATIYDKIVMIGDLMARGTTVEVGLDCIYQKYGHKPNETAVREAVKKVKGEVQEIMKEGILIDNFSNIEYFS